MGSNDDDDDERRIVVNKMHQCVKVRSRLVHISDGGGGGVGHGVPSAPCANPFTVTSSVT